jgi:hypothetical protein
MIEAARLLLVTFVGRLVFEVAVGDVDAVLEPPSAL